MEYAEHGEIIAWNEENHEFKITLKEGLDESKLRSIVRDCLKGLKYCMNIFF